MAEVSDFRFSGDLSNAVSIGQSFLDFQKQSYGQIFTGDFDGDPRSKRLFVIVGGRPDLPAVQIEREAFYRTPYLVMGVPSSVNQYTYLETLRGVDPTFNLVDPYTYSNPNVNSQTQAFLKNQAEVEAFNMGARERMEWQERQNNPFGLARSDFDTDQGRAALAQALIATGQLTIDGQPSLTGVAGQITTPEMVMSPPAPDMGGVWDARISAGDVDSFRGFNEPVRFGYGQSPLSYAGPSEYVSAPDNYDGLLPLIAIAGIFLALWR